MRESRLRDVAKVLKLANVTLAKDDISSDLRDGMIDMVEDVLINNGVYYGFSYVTESRYELRRVYAVHPELRPYM